MTHDDYQSIAALEALGVAAPDEADALREHLKSCAVCRAARDTFEESATLLALDLEPVEPPAHIRAALADSAGAAESRGAAWWLGIAATFFLALWIWREFAIRAARENDSSQRAEIRRLQSENALLTQRLGRLSADLAALASSDTREIALAGQAPAPAASARVFMTSSQRRAVVFFYGLPQNAADRSYQLWIVPAGGAKPLSAGVFDADPRGFARLSLENLPVDTPIEGFAVTLEPHGGVPQPSSTSFYLSGTV